MNKQYGKILIQKSAVFSDWTKKLYRHLIKVWNYYYEIFIDMNCIWKICKNKKKFSRWELNVEKKVQLNVKRKSNKFLFATNEKIKQAEKYFTDFF